MDTDGYKDIVHVMTQKKNKQMIANSKIINKQNVNTKIRHKNKRQPIKSTQ